MRLKYCSLAVLLSVLGIFNANSQEEVAGDEMSRFAQSGRVPAGDYNPLREPNTYRSEDNPLYWKNNLKENSNYWQQDVHYQIDALLDDKANTVEGAENLTYWNNSNDTLTKVYFHLYQNAFQPGSYYHLLNIANKRKPEYGVYEQQGLGTVVNNLRVDGDRVETNIDNTILEVQLNEPLYPGEKVNFRMEFTTFFDNGSLRRRMKMFKHHGVKHFDGVLWYPRIAVYDQKIGWQVDQHLGKEFYGDFGTFDVRLTLPEEYIVQGTGNLVNREEVLPEELMELISLENYRIDEDRSREAEGGRMEDQERNLERIRKRLQEYFESYEDSLKTWIYHAENVHDFAFTADPKYRIGIEEVNGIRCIALAMEHKAKNWVNIPEFTADVVRTFNRKIGQYPYPKVVVADARDGMEYPMITLCGGNPPSNYDLIAHEVGHMWFHSAVGTNEAYRAAMDEGFTQMMTAIGLDGAKGKYASTPNRDNWYRRAFTDSITNREGEVYTWYLNRAIRNEDARLNVHSHKYNSELGHGGGYDQVYYKMGTMLFNLQYVLGNDLFFKAMRNYFNNWKIRHPYPDDFKQSMMDYTGVDLNWFFDQWMNTTKTIDYKIKNVKKGDTTGKYTITFERKGRMEMPVEFRIITKSGQEKDYLIPNTYFEKNTDAEVLPKWTGWGKKFNTTYKANVQVDGKIKNVIIDPSNRLGDVNKINNKLKGNVDLEFDSYVSNYPDINNYELKWRPDIWYNEIDGLKGGLHLDGNYMDYKHQFHFTAWYNSGVLEQFDEEASQVQDPERFPVNFNAWYKTPLTCLDHDLFIDVGGKILDGLYQGHLGFEKSFTDQDHVSLNFQTSIRPNPEDLDYLLYPNQWISDQWNNTINLTYNHEYDYFHGNGDIELGLQNSAFGSDYAYSRMNLTVENYNKLDELEIRTRTHFEYTLGTSIAPESQLYLSGARPEELMENKFTRSRGFFPNDWLGYGAEINHFHHGGGLNLRGYAGYLAPFQTEDEQVYTFSGNAGAALNVEVDFDKYINLRLGSLSKIFHFDTYVFGDVGIINHNSLNESLKLSKVRGDAGLGTALTIKDWGPLDEAKPLTIRFDMPFYLSHAPAVDDSNFAFRWMLGVERSF